MLRLFSSPPLKSGRSVPFRVAVCKDGTIQTAQANARLIAAAPDLLVALQECAEDLAAEIEARYSHGIKEHPAMAPKYQRDMQPVYCARAAIAKAQGDAT